MGEAAGVNESPRAAKRNGRAPTGETMAPTRQSRRCGAATSVGCAGAGLSGFWGPSGRWRQGQSAAAARRLAALIDPASQQHAGRAGSWQETAAAGNSRPQSERPTIAAPKATG